MRGDLTGFHPISALRTNNLPDGKPLITRPNRDSRYPPYRQVETEVYRFVRILILRHAMVIRQGYLQRLPRWPWVRNRLGSDWNS